MSSDPNESPDVPPRSSDDVTIESDKDSRMFAMLCHLLGIFTGFLGPLIIWLIKREEMPFVDDQGKEALNFQITIMIVHLINGVLMCVWVGFFTFPLIILASIIFGVMGAMAANKGEAYRYPICLRLIS